MKKDQSATKKIINRRARFDYDIDEIFEVGMVLSGAETKSLRLGHGHLQGAYVTVKDHELWLVNSTMNGAPGVPVPEDSQTRSRKLLAKQKEISKMITAKEQGKTIIPLEILTGKRYIKLKIATARGKREFDKRATIKRRVEQRHIDSTLKTQRRDF